MPAQTTCEHVTDCLRCTARLVWIGSLVDHPTCACGYRPDQASLERDQRAIDETFAAFLTNTPETTHAR